MNLVTQILIYQFTGQEQMWERGYHCRSAITRRQSQLFCNWANWSDDSECECESALNMNVLYPPFCWGSCSYDVLKYVWTCDPPPPSCHCHVQVIGTLVSSTFGLPPSPFSADTDIICTWPLPHFLLSLRCWSLSFMLEIVGTLLKFSPFMPTHLCGIFLRALISSCEISISSF